MIVKIFWSFKWNTENTETSKQKKKIITVSQRFLQFTEEVTRKF